jgi:hypothetical protein
MCEVNDKPFARLRSTHLNIARRFVAVNPPAFLVTEGEIICERISPRSRERGLHHRVRFQLCCGWRVGRHRVRSYW